MPPMRCCCICCAWWAFRPEASRFKQRHDLRCAVDAGANGHRCEHQRVALSLLPRLNAPPFWRFRRAGPVMRSPADRALSSRNVGGLTPHRRPPSPPQGSWKRPYPAALAGPLPSGDWRRCHIFANPAPHSLIDGTFFVAEFEHGRRSEWRPRIWLPVLEWSNQHRQFRGSVLRGGCSEGRHGLQAYRDRRA